MTKFALVFGTKLIAKNFRNGGDDDWSDDDNSTCGVEGKQHQKINS